MTVVLWQQTSATIYARTTRHWTANANKE